MRLFIGFRPSDEAVAHAAEAVVRIKPTASVIRWIPPERWHITFAFLGDVSDDLLPRITERLDRICRDAAQIHGVQVAGAGTFRGVLWLGLSPSERHSPLDSLARAIQRGMREERIALERRPWRAHLTVARWRPSRERDGQAREAIQALAGYAGPAFTVGQIHLVHSVTGPNPSYADLHTSGLMSSP